MTPASPLRPADRWLAGACAAFLLWRAGAALAAFEWTVSLGTHAQALRWSEAERIEATLRRLDRANDLPDGYLVGLYRAIVALPEETHVWAGLEPTDPRFKLNIWLEPLIYPLTMKRVPPGGKPRPTEGNVFLAFDATPLPGAERFERIAAEHDWKLWR